jgi:flagellar L-ring protein precursor FlgH
MKIVTLMLMTSNVFAQDTSLNAETSTSPRSGSLWSDSRARMLVGMEGNARMVGDLITIEISEQTSTRVQAGTESSRNSSVNAGVSSLFGIDAKLLSLYPDIGGSLSMDVKNSNDFRGDGQTTREGLLEGQITCKVVEVRPNGNLVIFGWKEVRSNQETQYLSLSGMVRPQDIQSNNTVFSHLIAEARIEYTGAGVVADKQSPGIGTRVVDHVWPF